MTVQGQLQPAKARNWPERPRHGNEIANKQVRADVIGTCVAACDTLG
jgi:hypothetical protein